MKVDEIPSRKIREVRPCYEKCGDTKRDCVFYSSSDCGGRCSLHHYKRESDWLYELDRPEKCPNNFYPEEMKALLNDRNMKDFL